MGEVGEDGIWEGGDTDGVENGRGRGRRYMEGGDSNRDEKWEGEVKTVFGRVETQIEMRNGRGR